MKKHFSTVIKEDTHDLLFSHLIREDMQEDLCFATYVPSAGKNRFTGILSDIILPEEGEREVHGNVGFFPNYFERVLKIAAQKKEGIVFLHSHPCPGWQGMSYDDKIAESRIAPAVYACTGLPFLGLTLGTDGSWSSRFWTKDVTGKRKYDRRWSESVRIIGKQLRVIFNDNIFLPQFDSDRQIRTISSWGEKTQEDISRLKIGIVGLGSVGSIVAEILARTGISYFTLIDFDTVELKNLDRLTNVFKKDIGRAKVEAIKDGIIRSASSPKVKVNCCEYSVCEEKGFKSALDCDLLFSCVDRPWGRQVLNFISYAHLIPVIDGGIFVRTNKDNSRLIGSDWKAQTVGYKRACLECLGQYKTENAILEKSGLLDDQSYINGMNGSAPIIASENVYAFSSHLASMEVLQMLNLFISPSGISDVGQQVYHFSVGNMEVENLVRCHEICMFQEIVGKGDFSGIIPTGSHAVAEKERSKRRKVVINENEPC